MISIFAKPAFLNINPSQPFKERTKPPKGHLMRVSSIIRGEQIAERIGAKLNPTEGYEDDVCIYVKPMVRRGEDFKFEGKPYLDIIDGHSLGSLAEMHPEVTVIVCSQADMEIMSGSIKNKLVFIPQHHCNFEGIKRARKKIETVGVIGTWRAFDFIPEELKKGIRDLGMEYLEYSKFFRREDIINFYLKIDVQLVWRPYKKILSNPLKIVNASSFGIPTIALDEPAFKEVEGCYRIADDIKAFLTELKYLKAHQSVYDTQSRYCLKRAEDNHIERIGRMYKELV
jgi:hypothetical protein